MKEYKMKLDDNATTVLLWAMGIAAATIVVTAFMFSPDTCVDEKLELSSAKLEHAIAMEQKQVLGYGQCVEYPSVEQKLCRSALNRGGRLYIEELILDGSVVKEVE